MAKKPQDEKKAQPEGQAEKPQAAAKPAEGQAKPQQGQPGNGQAPTLNVLVQYVKDFSFENPGAPKTLRGTSNPGININVNVAANPIADKEFDVTLTLMAKAEANGTVLFNVELVYGGVFRVAGFPQEHMLPVLFIECPRILFPFARQIIAEATRNGGFPPLMIDPIDFAQMFQQRMAEEQARNKVQASVKT